MDQWPPSRRQLKEPKSPIITGLWVLGATIGVAFWTVVIWAIIQLVSHWTAQ